MTSHAYSRLRLNIVLALVIALGLSASRCMDAVQTPPGEPVYARFEDPFVQDIAERDSVLAAIASLDLAPIKQAFKRLSAYQFTRYFRTEQLDNNEHLVAFRERTTLYSGLPENRRYDVIDQDSSGAFDFGFFERFVSANVDEQDPRDLTPHVLPEDPTYLSPRNYEAYLYRFRPDTLLTNGVVDVLEVRAIPGAGNGKNIRRVRFYADDSTRTLMAIRLRRIDLALFFREESTFFVHIQQMEDGAWVPLNTRFESLIIMPFRPPQLFRTVATYSDFEPIEREVGALHSCGVESNPEQDSASIDVIISAGGGT